MNAASEVSVCIPVGRPPRHVAAIVRSLHEQGFGGEIILVCGEGEGAGLGEVLPAGAAPLRIIASSVRDDQVKRNLATRAATGRWRQFLDDDIELADDFVAVLDRLSRQSPTVVIQGCPYAGTRSGSWLARSEAKLYEARLRQAMSGRTLSICDARNLLIPGDLALAWPFNEDMRHGGGGHELAARLASAGIEVRFAPELMVFHRHRETLKDLFGQKFRHGRGRLELWRRNGGSMAGFFGKHLSGPFQYYTAGHISGSVFLYALLCAAAFCTGALERWAREPFAARG